MTYRIFEYSNMIQDFEILATCKEGDKLQVKPEGDDARLEFSYGNSASYFGRAVQGLARTTTNRVTGNARADQISVLNHIDKRIEQMKSQLTSIKTTLPGVNTFEVLSYIANDLCEVKKTLGSSLQGFLWLKKTYELDKKPNKRMGEIVGEINRLFTKTTEECRAALRERKRSWIEAAQQENIEECEKIVREQKERYKALDDCLAKLNASQRAITI